MGADSVFFTQTPDLAEHFWPRVDKNGPIVRLELGPCWIWIGARTWKGYGRIWINGRLRSTHHIALGLVGFLIPFIGLQVLHACDNPPCCNPAHLRIGTPQDDVDDKVSKGRQRRGEHAGGAKLQQVDVDEIRRLSAIGGISQRALAKQFSVHRITVRDILRGKTWAPSRPLLSGGC